MLRSALFILITAAVALSGGTASLLYALSTRVGLGAVTVGGWTAYPELGMPTSNPYAQARIAMYPLLMLGRQEGMVYSADRDSNGERLQRDCSYALEGSVPVTRFWTLHAEAAGLMHSVSGGSLSSYGVLFLPDNSLSIAVGAQPAPGNWLRVTGTGPMSLKLTLYDAPAALTPGAADTAMPQILNTGCNA